MKHCLIVDDSAVIRKVVRRMLEEFRFVVTEAEDGRQGVAACAQSMPDAVIVDWNLEDMDAFATLRAMRGLPGGDQATMLFCTTENDVGYIARAMRAGANDYLMKPFDKAMMRAKLAEHALI